MPGCDSAGAAKRTYPTPETRGGGLEEQLHVQGAVAARAQEGLENLSHVEGQEGWWGGDNPSSMVRSSGCALLEQP